MARRKGISSNTNKSRGAMVALGVQPSREHTPTGEVDLLSTTNENMKPNPASVLLEKPREEFHSLNNNNDSRYLHKKFKKMAVVQPVILQVESDLSKAQLENITKGSTSHLSSGQDCSDDRKISERVADYAPVPNSTYLENSTTKLYVPWNSGSKNNVQINLKEISDKKFVLDGKSENLNHDSNNAIGSKVLSLGENQESCEVSRDSTNSSGNGRHICPYCKLSCAKPSVLQKHIRAHTNERPYPCVPCGFAFKTKSNLYKHRRSRAHALKLQGSEDTPNIEEDWSLGSETDVVNGNNSSRSDSAWNSDKGSSQSDILGANDNSSVETISECISPPNFSGSQNESRPKTIYKPKFHKANLYQEDDESQKTIWTPNPEFLNRHISKIISQNEAIVDTLDSHLHRKFIKDSSYKNSNEISSSQESLKNDVQPLNLTKNIETSDVNYRKRCYSESFAQPESSKAPQHPLNPERSIIKDLLLKARAQATGLLPVTSETYDASETLYICPLCQIPYRSADNLEIHRLYYCKGNSTNNSNILFNGSLATARDTMKITKEHNYLRSNSVHVTLPETYNPNTLAKLASSTLKCPSGRLNKPENLIIHKSESNEISTPLPSPGPLLGNTRLVDTQRTSEVPRSTSIYLSDNARLNHSPHRRRDDQNNSENYPALPKINEENLSRSEMYSPPSKIRCSETPTTLRSLEELSLSPMRQNSTSLQMFGGEVKILDNTGGTTTMRIEPTTSQQSPTLISQSRASPKAQGPENIVVRSGLHSGGTIVHNPPTPKEPLPSPHPQTPRLLVSIAPNISTPNLSVAGIPAPNMTKFQFPPIGSITAYNPLTLPPLSPVASPSGASTILHGGKLIPYVPGMPGPNSLGPYLPTVQKVSINMVKPVDLLNNSFENQKIDDSNLNEKLRCGIDCSDSDISNAHYFTKLKNSNINILSNDKKESHWKNNNLVSQSSSSPTSKLTVPTIKIICDTSSPTKNIQIDGSMYTKLNTSTKFINELLRKHTECQQKKSTLFAESPRETKVSLFHANPKSYSLTKQCDGYQDTSFKESVPKLGEKERKLSFKLDQNQFNFENLISKSEILNKPIEISAEAKASISHSSIKTEELSAKTSERSETSYFKKAANVSVNNSKLENQKPKFLRPTSLPLKPGTFTPKRHHGITPNANTLPLISPETPRPAKAYGQLYLNGHAYTYLGLKCSTKVYYCTLNRPQPTYVANQHSLSMYSNWQVCSEATPHPLGLSPGKAMTFYDSRHRPQNVSVAKMNQDHLMTHSSQWSVTVSKQQEPMSSEADNSEESKTWNGDSSGSGKNTKNLKGGFESNEEYTYVRGRGRGRYVCSECGIRCKKPSMLKKHIRTHTDVRPFTCKHCAFSFKTKGNLTKHMKSKAHYKKCVELGISPLEDGEIGDGSQGIGESEDDSESEDDGNEGETESSDTDSWKSRLEHEAAHSLLSLRGGRLEPAARPTTYPYTARPTTYPYSPNVSDASSILNETSSMITDDSQTHLSESTQSVIRKHPAIQSVIFKQEKPSKNGGSNSQMCYPMDLSKPIDLSKGDNKDDDSRINQSNVWFPAADILTPVGEPDFLASLVQSTAKLPQRTNEWHEDEPMLQAYLTEKALQDSKIKQSQYTTSQIKQIEVNSVLTDSVKNVTSKENLSANIGNIIKTNILSTKEKMPVVHVTSKTQNLDSSQILSAENSSPNIFIDAASTVRTSSPAIVGERNANISNPDISTSTENAKFVASEYLKVACGKSNSESSETQISNKVNCENRMEKNNVDLGTVNVNMDENSGNEKEADLQKISSEHIGVARKVVVGAGGVGFKLTSPSNEFSSVAAFAKGHLTEDGRSVCVVCNKTFSKPSQLRLHINIHYMERPFRCSACAVSFRTRGHLLKHERSGSHHNKVSMTSTFGAATTTNPRPFKCSDCKIAFRIHGHLAKHLRSKMHVMRLECLGKLPFGTYAEIERAGVSLTDIDTTDCDNSLASLQILAQKLHEKDPTKLEKWDPVTMAPPLLPPGPDYSDEDEPASPQVTTAPDGDIKNVQDSDSTEETNVKHSATDT